MATTRATGASIAGRAGYLLDVKQHDHPVPIQCRTAIFNLRDQVHDLAFVGMWLAEQLIQACVRAGLKRFHRSRCSVTN